MSSFDLFKILWVSKLNSSSWGKFYGHLKKNPFSSFGVKRENLQLVGKEQRIFITNQKNVIKNFIKP